MAQRSKFVGFVIVETPKDNEQSVISTISSSTFLVQLNSIINVQLHSIDQFQCFALDVADRVVHLFAADSSSSDDDVDVVYVSESHSAFTIVAVYVLLGTIGGIMGTIGCAYVIYKWSPSNGQRRRNTDSSSSAIKRLKSVSKSSICVQKHESLDSSALRRNLHSIEINHYEERVSLNRDASEQTQISRFTSDTDNIGEATLLNTEFPLTEQERESQDSPISIHRRANTMQNVIGSVPDVPHHQHHRRCLTSPKGVADGRELNQIRNLVNLRESHSVHIPFRKRIAEHSITEDEVCVEPGGSAVHSGSTETVSYEEENPLKLKGLTERKKSRNRKNKYSPIPAMGDEDGDGDGVGSYPDTVAYRGDVVVADDHHEQDRHANSETFSPVGGHSNFHIGLRTDAVDGRESRAHTLYQENILLSDSRRALHENEEFEPRATLRDSLTLDGTLSVSGDRAGSTDTHHGSFSKLRRVSENLKRPVSMQMALAHPSHAKYHSFGGHDRIKHFQSTKSMDSDSLSMDTEVGDLVDPVPHSAPNGFLYLAAADTPEIPEEGTFIKDTSARHSFEPSTSSMDVMFNGDTNPKLAHAYSATMPGFTHSHSPEISMIRRDVISQSMADIHEHHTGKVMKSVSKSIEKMVGVLLLFYTNLCALNVSMRMICWVTLISGRRPR